MAAQSASMTVGVELVAAHSIDSRAFWLDLADRVGRSFLQNLVVFFTAGATITSVSWPTALSSAALAALVSLLLGLSTATAISSGNLLIDLADRAGRTFVGALVAAIPATGTLADIDWPAALTIAATATMISIITSFLTSGLGPARGLPSLAPVRPALITVADESSDDLAPRKR